MENVAVSRLKAAESPKEAYEPWAEVIRHAYDRRESAMFVLHNNIKDVFPIGEQYVGTRRYLELMLERGDYIVINYDVSRGMRFVDDKEAVRFLALANRGRAPEEPLIRSVYDFPRESTKALAFIEAFIVAIESSERPVAVILEYAEHLAPNGNPQTMTEVDRINSVTLQRFSQLFYERLQEAGTRDAVCFLLAPNLHDLHPDLVRSEFVTVVDVPRPGPSERQRFIAHSQAKLVLAGQAELEADVDSETLVEQTAGLTLTGIRHLFSRALQAPERKLSASFLMERKRELIERDSRGMLSVLNPKHGLDAVGGNDAIKAFLAVTAADLKAGALDVPVGVVCPGPNGVGKTFIAKAFARDAGVNAVVLNNFRGMYVGQTEANLDTIFNILKAMTPNIVVVDEADKTLGNEQSSAGNKVDDRVFGAFTAFMGDPEYRGKIFWMLLTARPFELAPDTGRPGRVEEHLPILAPETFDDKKAVLAAVLRARRMTLVASGNLEPSQAELTSIFDTLGFVTPAALELVANRARRRARRQAAGIEAEITPTPVEIFADEAKQFVPEGSKLKLQLQTLEAVLYTNHLSYLPEFWRRRLQVEPDILAQERDALRRLVGYA